MVIRRTTYPQVDPRAEGLMTRAMVVVPRALPIGEASRLARRRCARLVVARVGRGFGGATPATLERAVALGLDRTGLDAVLWEAPAVSRGAAEIPVRRRLDAATPFVVVIDAGRPLGAVLREPGSRAGLPQAVPAALARLDARTGRTLRTAGALGDELGWPVAAVGGFARDLLGGDEPARAGRRDIDLAVEGDARLLARRLAEALGGRVVQHAAFLTATVVLSDGSRVDLATTRRERYPRPGILPEVEPATLADDLARRDFSVNALAIVVSSASAGQVLDPVGGLVDLRAGRIRVLHPLSFIEDPTRIFRAVRFAVRLGFRLDRPTRRLAAAAAALPVYAALSGDRLRAELDLILGERAPAEILARLGRLGAFRLLEPGYRFSAVAARRLARVAASAARLPLAPDTVRALYLLALGGHLGPEARRAWLDRLALPVPLRAAVEQAGAGAGALIERLEDARSAAEAFTRLRGVPEAVAAWVHVEARGTRVRRYVVEHLTRWRAVRPLLTGGDLQAMGLRPGPQFGRLLEGLVAAQVAGRLRSRAEARAWVRQAAALDPAGPEVGSGNGTNPNRRGG
jgi:tRNA nucleotidyltransferase (CCA-adding enzyme)